MAFAFNNRRAGALAAVLLMAACGSAGFSAPAALVPAAPVQPGEHTDHVIVVSVDGLRPDAIGRYEAETMQRLVAEGSFSFEATTILPSRTLPSHTSMLTGVDTDVHGITWNTEEVDEHGHVATPTIFAAAHEAGFTTAAFFSKSKFQHLAVPGTLDYVQVPDGFPGKWTSERTVDDVERYLASGARPNLMFVHLAEPDFVGHAVGWMTAPYGWAVREADEELGELLDAADRAFGEGDYTLLLTADHGGHGRDHGSADPRDVTIPWIAWGEGVAARALEPGIRTMDTAATALWLLGVEPGVDTEGRPIVAAFTDDAPPLASAL